MLPESVWSMPPLGSINLHGSLLPHYRGAAPINWAIINGELKTGVTTFFLKHEIDTGDILYKEEIEITENDNAGTIHDKLMELGAKLIVKTTQAIIDENYTEIPQKNLVNEELKHAPKIFKNNCRVNWNNDVVPIFNLIRGLSPFPAAWSILINDDENTIGFKIFSSQYEVTSHNLSVGTILSDDKTYIKIAAANGYIFITELQLSGKKRMKAMDFLLGFKNISAYKAG
jgi:methionyl-tRNA formyltransferase